MPRSATTCCRWKTCATSSRSRTRPPPTGSPTSRRIISTFPCTSAGQTRAARSTRRTRTTGCRSRWTRRGRSRGSLPVGNTRRDGSSGPPTATAPTRNTPTLLPAPSSAPHTSSRPAEASSPSRSGCPSSTRNGSAGRTRNDAAGQGARLLRAASDRRRSWPRSGRARPGRRRGHTATCSPRYRREPSPVSTPPTSTTSSTATPRPNKSGVNRTDGLAPAGGRTSRSSTDELRLAGTVLDERLHADGAVVGGEQRGKLLRLDRESGVEVDRQSLVDRLLRRAQGIGRAVGELLRPPAGGVVDLLGRNDLVDETDPQRLLRTDEAAREAEVLRLGRTD